MSWTNQPTNERKDEGLAKEGKGEGGKEEGGVGGEGTYLFLLVC